MLFAIFLFCLIAATLAFVFSAAFASREDIGSVFGAILVYIGLWLTVIAAIVAVISTLIKIGVIHPF